MLHVFRQMNETELSKLMGVYAESNLENVEYFYPGCTDIEAGVKAVEDSFKEYVRTDFLLNPENMYYIWEVDGLWVSALRLSKLDGFYYLEALETRPDSRKKGYGRELFQAVFEYLKKNGSFIIRDNVGKHNAASLATHKSVGFAVEYEDAIDFLHGEEAEPRCYGMVYRYSAQ